ncbi:MAG: polysaccharide biosynthesis C-terminal domain-containing protein, partial [Schwartzia sp.]|nr:polysaccharide biosynthesis C-terminal domain-containing protein [Schwartzia sp. (in: firmicutes)]
NTGGSALIASLIGAGKLDAARKGFSFLLLSCVAGSALLAALTLIFLRPLVGILGADAGLLPLCEDYIIPLVISGPFIMGGIILDGFLIVEGRPMLSMASSLFGGFINIALDYVFLFQWGMGIEGAGIASGIGYSVSALIGLFYFGVWRKGTLRLVRPGPHWAILRKSASNGVSEMVSMLSGSVVIIVLNNTMMGLAGENGVAAISIAQYVEELLTSAYLGYAEGVAPLMSYNHGARDFEKVRRIFRFSLRIVAAFGVFTFLISLWVAEPVVAAFAEGSEAVFQMAVHGFHIFAVNFLFVGFNIYASSFFTALNDGRISALLSFCHTLVFMLGMLLLLPCFFGVDGVWLANPAAEILAMGLSFWMFREKGKAYGM